MRLLLSQTHRMISNYHTNPLKSYLSRRKQRVVIKDAISSTGELKVGVPQGSVLGPLLFLSFISLTVIPKNNT
jgi:hypothetical protein